jgi:hypothetical protein
MEELTLEVDEAQTGMVRGAARPTGASSRPWLAWLASHISGLASRVISDCNLF